MNIHILGIAGTFMGGLAMLASELKYRVSGSDKDIYPPMSTQLENQGIELIQGFDEDQLDNLFSDTTNTKDTTDTTARTATNATAAATSLVVGNVMRRGHPVIEAILDRGIPMLSGPEWLAKFVLPKRHVLAVSGTHGKTTTSSMLAWILEYAGLKPGFLIGGIPNNFGISARLGEGKYFVVEADEYDSAFFDKRSKFIHYRPRTLIINNIEFDHADIFPNLKAIQNQFHHLIRTIPKTGLIIHPLNEVAVDEVLKMGLWTATSSFTNNFFDSTKFASKKNDSNPNQSSSDLPVLNTKDSSDNNSKDNSKNNSEESNKENNKDNNGKDNKGWYSDNSSASGHAFDVYHDKIYQGRVEWSLLGQHNISNALAAIAASAHVGVPAHLAIEALNRFQGVKRRLELKGRSQNISVYDDFAHHPTAIKTTLAGLRANLGQETAMIAVLDIRSNTMKAGHHKDELPDSVQEADAVYFFKSADIAWDVDFIHRASEKPGGVFSDIEELLRALLQIVKPGNQVIFMSNGGFGGIHQKFLDKLTTDIKFSHMTS